jgi:hypothetical protein
LLLKGASVKDAMDSSGASGNEVKEDLERLHKEMEKKKVDAEKAEIAKKNAEQKALADAAKAEIAKKEAADKKKAEAVKLAETNGLSDGSSLEV